MKRPAFFALLVLSATGAAPARHLGEIHTAQYRQLQARICRGWNTWYNDSMTSHTFLPDGFTVNFGLAQHNGKEYQRDFRKQGMARMGILPGLRADDGRYTSAELIRRDFALTLETGTDGEDFVALVTPSNRCGHLVIAEVCYPWGLDGQVGRAGEHLVGTRGARASEAKR